MKKSTNYNQIDQNNKKLKNEIKLFHKIIYTDRPTNIIKKKIHIDDNMIKKYKRINETYSINYIWKKMLEEETLKNNYNLILIDILIKQKKLLKETNPELIIINKGLEHISKLCEDYFIKDKYLNENIVLDFINELLKYLTKIIICNGIEYMVRKILYDYFSNASVSNSYQDINIKINYIFENIITDINISLKELLSTKICERLVKASVIIFTDKFVENQYLKYHQLTYLLLVPKSLCHLLMTNYLIFPMA
jgi:hypothetical protein